MENDQREFYSALDRAIIELKEERDHWFDLAMERGAALIGLITLLRLNIHLFEREMQDRINKWIDEIVENDKVELWILRTDNNNPTKSQQS